MKKIVRWLSSKTGVETEIKAQERARIMNSLMSVSNRYYSSVKYRPVSQMMYFISQSLEIDPETGEIVLAKVMETLLSSD
ncbi:hypothetical protein ACE38W_00565 [Chitinophaga sp. Hz27]|uniref:hypothetical protein n=1 Tax=Chitinophaga sp. Hz27 TaxID=3347169 RepID=UPI0035DEFFCF